MAINLCLFENRIVWFWRGICHAFVDSVRDCRSASLADVTAIYGYCRYFTDIGINSATYIGYSVTGSVWGAVVATVAVCLPSFLMVLFISYFFVKFKNNKYVNAAMSGLLPMSVALIGAAALLLMNGENFIDYKSILIFIAAFILTWRYKVHPILMICLAGVMGFILY